MAGWTYTIQSDQGGAPRWWLKSAAGDVMAYSEAFASDANARRGALNFKEHAAVWRYSTFKGANDRWYWHAQGANNEIVASGGNFPTETEASGQSNAVRVNGGTATGPCSSRSLQRERAVPPTDRTRRAPRSCRVAGEPGMRRLAAYELLGKDQFPDTAWGLAVRSPRAGLPAWNLGSRERLRGAQFAKAR